MQRIRVTRPDELLAAVPYLIGFHPTESLVLVGVRAGCLHFALRADLEECLSNPEASATHVTTVLARQGVDTAFIIGYGQPDRTTPVLEEVRRSLTGRKIPVADALRVTEGRFYSYDCMDPTCCPPLGRAFQPENSVIAAEATVAGHVALPDRDALTRSLAPVQEPARTSMAHATDRAEARIIAGLEQTNGRQVLVTEGMELIETALNRHYTGSSLTDDEAAWLSALLILIEVRDAGSRLIEQQPDDSHVALWTDIVRRAQPGMLAPAGTLLAYAAYLSGRGALASVALQRVLDDDPDYPMARSLHDAILSGVPPHRLRARRVRRRRGVTNRAGPRVTLRRSSPR